MGTLQSQGRRPGAGPGLRSVLPDAITNKGIRGVDASTVYPRTPLPGPTETFWALFDSDTGRTAATVTDAWSATGAGSSQPTTGHTEDQVTGWSGIVAG